MKIHTRCRPEPVDPGIASRVESDIAHALNAIVTVDHRFIVNDTAWFGKRANGNITPSVMNMAGFISGKFQNTLRDDRGWKKDATVVNQEIDAYVELEAPGQRMRIPPDGSFIEFFSRYHAKSLAAILNQGCGRG